ncbi:hypothetical protein FKM82_008236 [Ascaphus truei]
MPRRRHGTKTENGAHTPCKLLRGPEVALTSVLNFSNPESLFESIISPIKSAEFFCEYWEKKPLIIHRSDPEMSAYYQSLFSVSDLKHITGRGIYYGRDVNVCKCKGGKKVSLQRAGKASYLHLMKDFGRLKATIQFHQPQRFNDKLWHIMEKLECFFGTLVGSNVYITPPDSRGLPAHYDDVEVFVLQLEGEKHWHLYKPTVPLAREYNVVPEDKIGPPTHDILLKPGDLLYFPRGVIHHAHTPAGSSHSTHVTISTYQKNTWTDYLQDLLPGLLFDSATENINLRRGIPRQQLMQTDTTSAVNHISELLMSLVKRLKTNKDVRSFEMIRDFMGNRLPPYLEANSSLLLTQSGNVTEGRTGGCPPKLDSTVTLQYKEYATITVGQVPNEDTHDMMVYVYYSLNNDRETHMMKVQGDSHVNGLRFPLSFMDALKQLWTSDAVHVRDLPLGLDGDKENLAISLWTAGLIAVHPTLA